MLKDPSDCVIGYNDMESANNAWNEERYLDAIELWTEAIEVTVDNNALLKVLYSNRSAAFSKYDYKCSEIYSPYVIFSSICLSQTGAVFCGVDRC